MEYVVSRESTACKIVSVILALIVHVGLLMFLVLGVQWATNETPAGDPLSVDLWGAAELSGTSASIAEALPALPSVGIDDASISIEPSVEMETLPEPISEPVSKPTPDETSEVIPEITPDITSPSVLQPDIALEQIQKEKEKQAQEERLRAQQLAQEKQARQKAEQLEKERQARQQEKERKAQEAAQRQAREQEKKVALEKERQRARQKAEAAREQERQRQKMAEQARREAALRESVQRERANLQSGAGTGTSGSAGMGSGSNGRTGAGGTGLLREQAAYVAKIRAMITPNIRYDPAFAETVVGTPEATFEVSLLPDGTIGRVELKQNSGNASYNRIIRAAIDKTGRLPLPDRPEILPERRLILNFRYP